MKTTDTTSTQDTASLQEQAAHWWVVLNDPAGTAADRQAFADWVSRSPVRIEAYLRVSLLDGALHSRSVHWPDTPAEQLIQEVRAGRGGVVSSPRFATAARPRASSSRWGARMMLYGSLAAMLIAAVAVWRFDSQHQYRTGLGEQRSVVLDDGSIVILNTSSAIEVAYGGQRRLIRLTRGEALFQVAHDIARPFDVTAGEVTIRAVGTQFNVDRRVEHTTVTVVEGTVQVSAEAARGPRESGAGSNDPSVELLAAAQQVVVSGTRISLPQPVLDVAPVTAWTRRQLVFEDRPLDEVAEEFNRYNRQHILIESPDLRSERVTGVFQANDPASFLAFVSGIPGVSVQTTRQGHHVVTVNQGVENFGAGGGPN